MATQVVSFHCILKNKLGSIIGRTFNQNVIVAADPAGPKLPGLVEGLKGIKSGERREISLAAKEAYGYYDPQLIIECHPEEIVSLSTMKIGDKFIFASKGRERVYRITEMAHDKIVFDGNHPLAGQDLIFEIEATEAREATQDDLHDEVQARPTSVTFH